jgi:hypothetical protein
MKKAILSILLVSFGVFAFSQSTTEISLAGLNAIQENDLRKDLYEFADASFKGRAAGTIDELNAAVWVAERYRTIGLQPAGDNNSYFQFFNMWRNRIAETSTVSINDRTLTLWSEVAIAQMDVSYRVESGKSRPTTGPSSRI